MENFLFLRKPGFPLFLERKSLAKRTFPNGTPRPAPHAAESLSAARRYADRRCHASRRKRLRRCRRKPRTAERPCLTHHRAAGGIREERSDKIRHPPPLSAKPGRIPSIENPAKFSGHSKPKQEKVLPGLFQKLTGFHGHARNPPSPGSNSPS